MNKRATMILDRYLRFLNDTYQCLQRKPERRMTYKAMHFEIAPVSAAVIQRLGICRYYGSGRWEWMAEVPTKRMAEQLHDAVVELQRGYARQHQINKAQPGYRPRRSIYRPRRAYRITSKTRSSHATSSQQ